MQPADMTVRAVRLHVGCPPSRTDATFCTTASAEERLAGKDPYFCMRGDAYATPFAYCKNLASNIKHRCAKPRTVH
eukprot:14964381-Alexandrium_andersonii.AAC.1